ncbi:MAG: aryl-sulfate sulfotransferase [Solirubrobacterales bacterium]|nr:aryl-sulfate sulfotransferase [Solirubrobacterales bacterium]
MLQGVIQEIDIATGRVLLEWRSLDHIPLSDSFFPPNASFGYDYLHINSIDIAPDGNLLLSARHTWALYKIDRRTGQVMWRLGGKSSDFDMDDDAKFAWQHDARHRSDGTVTVFDDGAANFPEGAGSRESERQSRGVVLDVDENGRRVRLLRSYRHPKPLLASSMGNFQTLSDGHVLLGWGSAPTASEFAPGGALLADVDIGKYHGSYRSYRYPWTGYPTEPPAIAVRRGRRDRGATLYASWNGATEVSNWVVSTGERTSNLRPAGIVRRQGFETAILLTGSAGYAKVTAIDAAGRHLGSSRAVRI